MQNGSTAFQASLYDGSSARGIQGSLTIASRTIVFYPGNRGENSTIRFDNILEMRNLSHDLRIKFNSSSSDGIIDNSLLLIVHDQAMAAEIVTRYKKLKGKPIASEAFRGGRFYRFLALIAGGSLAVLLGLYTGVRNLYRVIPTSADIAMGERVYAGIKEQFPICDAKQINARVKRVVDTLKPKSSEYRYDFTIVETEEQNAFALPGGNIVIFSGLIRKSENINELAGVLAHEIGHVENRHGIRQMLRVASISIISTLVIGAGFEGLEGVHLAESLSEMSVTFMSLRYSREFESEADLFAARLLNEKKVGMNGLIQFFKRIQESGIGSSKAMNFVSTHPSTEDRIASLKALQKEEHLRGEGRALRRLNGSWSEIRNQCH